MNLSITRIQLRMSLLLLVFLLPRPAVSDPLSNNAEGKIFIQGITLSQGVNLPERHRNAHDLLATALRRQLADDDRLQTDPLVAAPQLSGKILSYRNAVLDVAGELREDGKRLASSRIQQALTPDDDWSEAITLIAERMLDELLDRTPPDPEPAPSPCRDNGYAPSTCSPTPIDWRWPPHRDHRDHHEHHYGWPQRKSREQRRDAGNPGHEHQHHEHDPRQAKHEHREDRSRGVEPVASDHADRHHRHPDRFPADDPHLPSTTDNPAITVAPTSTAPAPANAQPHLDSKPHRDSESAVTNIKEHAHRNPDHSAAEPNAIPGSAPLPASGLEPTPTETSRQPAKHPARSDQTSESSVDTPPSTASDKLTTQSAAPDDTSAKVTDDTPTPSSPSPADGTSPSSVSTADSPEPVRSESSVSGDGSSTAAQNSTTPIDRSASEPSPSESSSTSSNSLSSSGSSSTDTASISSSSPEPASAPSTPSAPPPSAPAASETQQSPAAPREETKGP